MNIDKAATGQTKRNHAVLRQIAKDTESIGCRLRRALDRGNPEQAKTALADLDALRDRLAKVTG